jgi:ribonuclease-3
MPKTPKADSVQSLAALLEQLPEDLARQAFTHASWVDHRAESYERLAFLGDVVLSLAVSDHLYPRFERYGAGRLTKLRAQSVSGPSCAKVAVELGVPERLRQAAPAGTGRSFEMLSGSERVLASICEAVIGACYLAFGIDRVAPAVVAAFEDEIDDALENPVDYKSLLQEKLARRAEVVSYRIESEDGPAHDRRFVAIAEAEGTEIGRGAGRTKKAAEQEAAMRALEGPGEV